MIEGFYVYKYVSLDGRIVYIGRSESLLQRIKQHSSYKGVDAKFERYKDAKIFVHRCNSRNDMNILEMVLIEKHKPELNVNTKTDIELSFDTGDIEWVSLEDILAEQEPDNKPVVVKKSIEKSEPKIIKSQKSVDNFIGDVVNWHVLFYFTNWLLEQRDDDVRATNEFSLDDAEEVSKWIWEYDEADTVHGVSMPYLEIYKYGCVSLVTHIQRKADRIWIDFYKPVNVLKKAIPLMMIDLKDREEKIKSYTDISETFVDECRETGFYDFFTTVRYKTIFPSWQLKISDREIREMVDELDNDNIPVKHTSPEIDLSGISLFDIMSQMHRSRVIGYRPGGAYWNVLGVGDHEGR